MFRKLLIPPGLLASSAIVCACLCCGCRDPILERVDVEGAAAPAAPPGKGLPPEGVGSPDDPRPGVPNEPPPGAPGSPEVGVPGDPTDDPDDGEKAVLKGAVVFPGYAGGTLRLDVFDGDQTDFSARPSVVAMEKLQEPGAFEFSVPVSAGRVWLSAFNDANENGRPDPQDPTGFYAKNPVDVSDGGEISGLTIGLEVRAPPEHQESQW